MFSGFGSPAGVLRGRVFFLAMAYTNSIRYIVPVKRKTDAAHEPHRRT
jgi:hypothetical protein